MNKVEINNEQYWKFIKPDNIGSPPQILAAYWFGACREILLV